LVPSPTLENVMKAESPSVGPGLTNRQIPSGFGVIKPIFSLLTSALTKRQVEKMVYPARLETFYGRTRKPFLKRKARYS
jgi:hypothetical protein